MGEPINDGGPAFPMPPVIADANHDHYKWPSAGMTLRDYFAAKCLCVLANNEWRPDSDRELAHLAARLYQMADAMLAERAKRGGA